MSTHEINHLTDAVELLDRAERRIAALEDRLARLEGSSPVARPERSDEEAALRSSAPVAVMEEVSSRRGLFKVAGAVASAAVAHSLLSASPAAAADGGNVIIGQANTASSDTTLTKSTNGGTGLLVTNGSTSGLADGVKGVSDHNSGAGVAGSSLNGYGVYGVTTNGYAMFSAGRFGLGGHLTSPGLPTGGNYELGDIIRDNVGTIYACVGAGSAAPNALTPAVFRKITGPATAGQMHLLASPLRAYDSRPGTPAASGGDGVIGAGLERMISLAQGRNTTLGSTGVAVPLGASGAAISLSVTSTTGSIGWIGCFANGTTYPGTANITWFGAGQTLSVTTMCGIDSAQRMRIYCGSNATHVIVDVLGYYA